MSDQKIANIEQFWARLGFNYAEGPACRYCQRRGPRDVTDSFGKAHDRDCDWYQLDREIRPTPPRPTPPLCPTCCQPLKRLGTLNNVPIWGHCAFKGPGSCGEPGQSPYTVGELMMPVGSRPDVDRTHT